MRGARSIICVGLGTVRHAGSACMVDPPKSTTPRINHARAPTRTYVVHTATS